MIDTLNLLGFCSSYHEIKKFERSAAYNQGTEIEGITDESFIQHVADNVDHNLRTIDGLNTFHGMGIIAVVTPKVKTSKLMPKVQVTSKDLIEIGNIEIYTFRNRRKSSALKFETLPYFEAANTVSAFDMLWQCAWLLKPHRPFWNGYMQMVHKGEHAGPSSVFFMPMIDMKASHES